MKKLILSFIAIATLSLTSLGQAPEGFKYQAVVRDAGNVIVNNQAVGMQIEILQGGIAGTLVYTESFAPTTNNYGLVNLEIGTGSTSDDFTTIDWANDTYFIRTSIDVTGGNSFVVMGTSQLMSVPYALHAKTAESSLIDNVDDADSDLNNEIQNLEQVLTVGNDANGVDIVNTGKIGVGTTTPDFMMDIEGTNGPRARIYSIDNYYAGLLTENASRQFFVGTQGTFEAADGTNSGFHIYDNTAGAQRLVVDAIGNVGIDNSAPLFKLDVNGTLNATEGLYLRGDKIITNDGVGRIEFFDDGGAEHMELNTFNTYFSTTPVVIENKLAIGSIFMPTADLEVTGTVKIVDGTEGLSKVLTSDAAGNASWQTPSTTCSIQIGDAYAGGVVFYVDGSGCHGLVAKATDEGAMFWSPIAYSTYAFATGIYGGAQATKQILFRMGVAGSSCAAASACDNLVSGGYSDWYLPSSDELQMMFVNLYLNGFGGMAIANYWSSTESLTNNAAAWKVDFSTGIPGEGYGKATNLNVRAVRAF